MDTLYLLLKFIHIAAVIVWVGGLFALVVLNARAATTGDAAARATLGSQSEYFGRAVIGPAMGLTLLAGVATAGRIGFPFSSTWIVWGLIGFVLSVFLGAVAIPRAGTALGAAARSAAANDPRVADLARRLGLLSALNILILASVVWAMVFKPTL
jgi:uncharacterized membrane protein